MRTLLLTFFAALLFAPMTVWGQSEEFFEGFEENAMSYTVDPPAFNNGSDGQWQVTDETVGGISARSGTSFWIINDLDDEGDNGTPGEGKLDFDQVDVSSLANVEISFAYNVKGYDSTDDMEHEAFFDGNSQGKEVTFQGQSGGASTDGWQTVTIPVPDEVSEVSLTLYTEQNGASDYAGWDDVKITSANPPPTPTVRFTASSATVNEDDGSATLEVSISSPNGTASSVDVAFDDGADSNADASDIDGFSSETVTFSASASDGDIETVVVPLTDDNDTESTETANFDLQNSTNTDVGSPSSFDLTIHDDEQPDLVINEFLADPNSSENNVDLNGDGTADSDDEFVEILNTSDSPIDISGYILDDDPEGGANPYAFPNGTILGPNESATIIGGQGEGGNTSDIPGFTDTGVPSLNNGGDLIGLRDDNGSLIQEIGYGSEGDVTEQDGISSARNPDGSGPFELQNAFGPEANHTAGKSNTDGSSLPVELTAFTVQADGAAAVLAWTTASETNNARFLIQHRTAVEKGDPASPRKKWKTIATPEGAGTTIETQQYSFQTDGLAPGSHTFRLVQVDRDGATTPHAPKTVRIAPNGKLSLGTMHPNPVRSQAQFRVVASEQSEVTVRLYDALGRQVKTVFTGPLTERTFTLRADDLPAGVYLLRATSLGVSRTQAVTLAR